VITVFRSDDAARSLRPADVAAPLTYGGSRAEPHICNAVLARMPTFVAAVPPAGFRSFSSAGKAGFRA